MKLFKILTYIRTGRCSIRLYGLSICHRVKLPEFTGPGHRNYDLTETIKFTCAETVNQSSLPKKERSQSNDFKISHDRKLNLHHGISRIVKRVDFKFLTTRLRRLNLNIQHIEKQEAFNMLDPIYIQNKLPKKLYLPNGSLQLFNIYVRN